MKNTNAHTSRFDIVICNPPYCRDLHLKILEKVIPHCEETINISPDSFVYDKFAKFDSSKLKLNFREKFLKHLSDYKHFDIDATNELFGTSSMVAVGICKFTQEGGFDYTQFEEKNETILKFVEQVEKQKSFRSQFIKKERATKFYVPIRRRSHDGVYKWFSENTGATDGIQFETEEERKNFIDSLECWPYKLLVAIGRGDNSAMQPFMNDYTKLWTNKRFCDYFNITGYIDDEHAEPDSEWEEILKTMEKYC